MKDRMETQQDQIRFPSQFQHQQSKKTLFENNENNSKKGKLKISAENKWDSVFARVDGKLYLSF